MLIKVMLQYRLIYAYVFTCQHTFKATVTPARWHSLWHGQWKEGNVLFNDALNTFYLRLYDVGHMVKNHSDSERGNPLPPHELLFPINSKVFFYMHHPTDRVAQWTQLQFGLFSVPTSGPQLVYQRPWYVLFCLWNSAYKRSLAAYRKE